jgi:DNA-binding beta-propeller fold protein YncE
MQLAEATHRPVRRSNPGQAMSSLPSVLLRSLGAGALVLAVACTASSEQVRPPADELFFPTGVKLAPDESALFVISANSDLRYDSGTVAVIDLDEVDATIERWLDTGVNPGPACDGSAGRSCCQVDPSFAQALACDEARFLRPGAGVRIGNFATAMDVQEVGGGDLRLVIPVRGDPSVTWIDFDRQAGVLRCGDAGGFPLCADERRLTRFALDDRIALAEEPFGVYADSGGEFAVVTHLSSGSATLVDLPVDGTPVLADAISGLFAADPLGRRGSVGVAGRSPGDPDGLVYVTSSTESRVQMFGVARLADGSPVLQPSAYFFLDRIGFPGGGSSNTRGVVFGQGGDRGYFLNREPPSVAVVDSSLDATGFPRNEVIGATDVCREGSGLAVADVGEGERVFVTCYQSGDLYVIDPRGRVEVEAVRPIGRGPFAVTAAPGRQRLYISNFLEHTVAVVDLTPGAPTQYRVVLRIGLPPQR